MANGESKNNDNNSSDKSSLSAEGKLAIQGYVREIVTFWAKVLGIASSTLLVFDESWYPLW